MADAIVFLTRARPVWLLGLDELIASRVDAGGSGTAIEIPARAGASSYLMARKCCAVSAVRIGTQDLRRPGMRAASGRRRTFYDARVGRAMAFGDAATTICALTDGWARDGLNPSGGRGGQR